ncbi:hypothetical protein LEMLEM_LOCUS1085 [Lemmus lemmus]
MKPGPCRLGPLHHQAVSSACPEQDMVDGLCFSVSTL